MSEPIKVLFLCAHNAARSIMAEAILNHLGGHRFRAFSAGTHARPDHRPHPMALAALHSAGIDTAGLRSKNWAEFSQPDSPHLDLIITVCNIAAGEPCPAWPGHPATAHWGYPDPTLVEGTEEERLHAFKQTMHALHQRMELLVNLPMSRVDRLVLETEARRLAASAQGADRTS
ncbi:arsenate reductase ArsC [Tepidicella baoligensis]|uniref:arsenate reductase/protein-tyrosine-phosphatase family protein n=1 Tax=Tepidicella baoligensis TaxID=2707016 RepID=UPI0015DB9C6E